MPLEVCFFFLDKSTNFMIQQLDLVVTTSWLEQVYIFPVPFVRLTAFQSMPKVP